MLYWFRTPPGIRVGGVPLDAETRRLIESRHPDLRFDWGQILGSLQAPADPPHGERPHNLPAQPGGRAGEAAARRRERERRGPPRGQTVPSSGRAAPSRAAADLVSTGEHAAGAERPGGPRDGAAQGGAEPGAEPGQEHRATGPASAAEPRPEQEDESRSQE